MPEHDRINQFIVRTWKVPYKDYSIDFEAVWSLVSNATMHQLPGGWYCKIDGVDWDGELQTTAALAVCNALYRSAGIPWSIHE